MLVPNPRLTYMLWPCCSISPLDRSAGPIEERTVNPANAQAVAVDFEDKAFSGYIGYADGVEKLPGLHHTVIIIMVAKDSKTGPLREGLQMVNYLFITHAVLWQMAIVKITEQENGIRPQFQRAGNNAIDVIAVRGTQMKVTEHDHRQHPAFPGRQFPLEVCFLDVFPLPQMTIEQHGQAEENETNRHKKDETALTDRHGVRVMGCWTLPEQMLQNDCSEVRDLK